MQNPIVFHDEQGRNPPEHSRYGLIRIYGKSRQTVCTEKDFEFTTERKALEWDSEWLNISDLYSDIEYKGNVPVTVSVTPGWSRKFCLQTSDDMKSIKNHGQDTEGNMIDGMLEQDAFFSDRYLCLHNISEEMSTDIETPRTVTVSIHRNAAPKPNLYYMAIRITDSTTIAIEDKSWTCEELLRSKGKVSDCLVLDFDNHRAYIERHISVDSAEKTTASIYDGYTVLESPEIIDLDFPDLPASGKLEVTQTERVTSLDLNTGKDKTDSLQESKEPVKYDVSYHALGIHDGMPPVRDDLISVFDGYNNSGLFLRQRFQGWKDILGNSVFDMRDFRGNTPLGGDSLYLSGNTSVSDLIAKMNQDIVEFTDADLAADSDTGDSAEATRIYKEGALSLDAHGCLRSDENGNYVVRKNGSFQNYSYLKEHSKQGEGYCTINLPVPLEREKGITIQVITQLTNTQDNYFIHCINGEMENLPENYAMEPYKDYALRFDNLNGITHLYLNQSQMWYGPVFSGDVRYIGSSPAYQKEGDVPYALGLGFGRDLSKEENTRIFRRMKVYAVYIYSRELTEEEISRNMIYAGARFHMPGYQPVFPKLEDGATLTEYPNSAFNYYEGGSCSTLADGLRFIGYMDGISDSELEERIREIGNLNMEHKLHLAPFSEEFETEMLRLMRDGKLKRPTAWDTRRERYGMER